LIQSLQQPLHSLSRLQLLADIGFRHLPFPDGFELPRLIFAQVGFIDQWPGFLFSQQVPAFIHRNLVQPGAERRPLIEPLQRKIRFHKNLLRDILHILTPPENSPGDRENSMLMAPDELFKRLFVVALRAAY
jgi:hypothetical protein